MAKELALREVAAGPDSPVAAVAAASAVGYRRVMPFVEQTVDKKEGPIAIVIC